MPGEVWVSLILMETSPGRSWMRSRRGGRTRSLYFNPGDLARPVGLNLLPKVPQDQAHLVVSGSPLRLPRHLGRELGTAAGIHPGACARGTPRSRGLTILALPRLLADDAFRERVTAKVRDPVVRAFWRDEYARYERRFRLEAIAPLQNKIGRLLGERPHAERLRPDEEPLRCALPHGPGPDHDRRSRRKA